ncbi:MAG: protein kinase [Deltaproteobacteria bacterium]|nr:protein kinase [Deltaproteobacteria bacterium]
MAQSQRLADVGVSIGQVFLNKYRVDAILGQGGMGVVARCTHLQLNESVAIKMLRKDVLLDRDAVERFTREAQAAAKLRSEYVARVSDVGTFDGGVPYMVMEFLDGHDLGELLEQRGSLPVPWACELMLQTAEALAEAHSIGVVHRDVKPTNLFVTWRPDGSALIKVLDFGISKSPVGTDMQLTQTQSLLGTPAYMSPEQMRSARLVDARTDIWSLGTVFYELIEGRRPFEAESFSEMCVKVAVDPPEPMVNAPPALAHVILRCLAKSPEQRYANMAELARDLVPFVQDPHQAMVLVERMARMLRRSHVEWEVPTASGVRGYVRTPPAGVPMQPMAQAEAVSRPVVSPSGVVEIPTVADPRRRVGGKLAVAILALCVLGGVGIGLAVALGGGGGDDKPAHVAATETAKETAKEPPPVDEPPTKKAEPKVEAEVEVEVEAKAKAKAADEPVLEREAPHHAAALEVPPVVAEEPRPPGGAATMRVSPPVVVKKDPPVAVKKDPPVAVKKDPPVAKKDPKADEVKPPPEVKRDPFDSARPVGPTAGSGKTR